MARINKPSRTRSSSKAAATVRKKEGADKVASADKDVPYKVGPGRPPRHTQFKPGQSGNPAGRPRKERSLLKLIDKELDQELQLTENGEVFRLTKREALAKKMVHDALKGDARAIAGLVKLIGPAANDSENDTVMMPLEDVLAFIQRSGLAKGQG